MVMFADRPWEMRVLVNPTRHRNVDVVFRFAADSLLEGDGFEPSVPRVMTAI